MSSKALQLARNEVFDNDTTSTTVDNNKVFHLITCEKFHCSVMNFFHKCRISTKKKLLTRLTLSVESTAYLNATKRAVSKHTTIFTSNRNRSEEHRLNS